MNIILPKYLNVYNITGIIQETHQKCKTGIKILLCSNAEEMLMQAALTQIDIAIISDDIDDEEIDGYDLAYHLKMINHNTLPIMIAKKEISVKAGRAELFGYIAPQEITTELPELINYAIQRFPRCGEKTLCYRWNNVNKEIKLEDIIYFSSDHKVVNIKAIDGAKRKFYQKLDVVEEALRQQGIDLLRANKSYLVNQKYIRETNKKEIILYDDEKISISPKYQSTGN